MNSGKEYSISKAKEIIKKNLKKNTYKVNFTGGDPLAQRPQAEGRGRRRRAGCPGVAAARPDAVDD